MGRLPATGLILPSIDLFLAALFGWAFVSLGRCAARDTRGSPREMGAS
jgi:hypothetical protein